MSNCSCCHDETQKIDTHHGHDHSHESSENITKDLIKLCAGAVIFGAGILLNGVYASFAESVFGVYHFWLTLSLYAVSYLIIGGNVLLRSFKNILKGQIFDENFLMTIASLGAFAIGEFPEGVAVMLFYNIGELCQEMAVNRSRRSITALMDIRPDYANIETEKGYEKVDPKDVQIGSLILVRPGEKIPLDGIVTEGFSALDTSALTGESAPVDVAPGSVVLSGSINKSGVLRIETTKEFAESTVSKILDAAQNARKNKSKTENFITKFAKYYTPAVVLCALGVALIPPIFMGGWDEWIKRGLIFLVISCPCALVISIPLGFFGGIGCSSKHGILVKGSNYLEALNKIDTVVFDKTGTLTHGKFKVVKICPNGISEEELLFAAAYAESFSSHPIAQSIVNHYKNEIDRSLISEYNEIRGLGICAEIDGKTVLAGNENFMAENGVVVKLAQEIGTVVYIAIDGNYCGYLLIADEIRDDSKKAIEKLKGLGVNNIAMFTGDNEKIGSKVASELGIKTAFCGLLPDGKVKKLETIMESKENGGNSGNVVFVGDGINDAPVLMRADVGIAMGGLGSDAAIEAADAVIMNDEPSKVVTAVRIAKFTRRIVWQNIFFAFGVKLIIMALGTLGVASMWEAVFADVGVALIAIFNAMRILRRRFEE